MTQSIISALLAMTVMTFAAECYAEAIQEEATGWLERDTLTGDWGGARPWLKEHGITLKPRITQFYQGFAAGEDDHDYQYGGKADLLLNADLGKLGLWNGFSLTVHAEQNFGEDANGRGGTVAPLNTALFFPGIENADYFDFSSVYLQQRFGESATLIAGKINIIDLASGVPFRGGAGIDSFWNSVFAATPSGTVPPYLMGAILSVRTEPATFGLWVYDPEDKTNLTGFENFFSNGVTLRGTVDFPVSIAGLGGHQGLVALYSTEPGNDLEEIGDSLIPPFPPGAPGIKNNRYYFAYNFDQYLYQSKANPKEGIGLFGQFGISDGNPNRLQWLAIAGVGGTGLIPGRSRDNWGVGYYYASISSALQESLAPILDIRNEQGIEVFYNFAVTPWFALGGDLQVIEPSLKNDTAVIPGLRTVIRF
ncbi:MAG: carbohydrate porin [Methylobacter sp.]